MEINTPLNKDTLKRLKAGDAVKITGTIYTARDAAHKRMLEEYEQTGSLPFDIKDQIIYYVGPTPAREGQVIGSAGPTTSGRMDLYTPKLLELGLSGMIGKGVRNDAVIEAMKKYHAVYIGAVGGAGALLSSHITKCDVLAYEDLGAEAIYKLWVDDFPGIVIIDALGDNLYENKGRLCV